jgi:hypothetical protein
MQDELQMQTDASEAKVCLKRAENPFMFKSLFTKGDRANLAGA